MIDQPHGNVAAWAEDEVGGILQSLLGPSHFTLARAASEQDLIQQVRHSQPLLAVIHSSQKPNTLPDLCSTLQRLQSDLSILVLLRPEHAHLQKMLNASPPLRFLVEPLDLGLLPQPLTQA